MKEPIRIELPTGFSVGSVNAYLFMEPEPTLVDCGMETDDCIATLEAGLADNGLVVADLKHVYVTHAHVDHMGLLGWLAERCDATFYVNEYCYQWAIDFEGRWQDRTEFLGDILRKVGMPPEQAQGTVNGFLGMSEIWRSAPAERVQVFEADGEVEIGGLTWQSIYLPGHAAMQTGFYQPDERWLLSADSLLHLTPVPVIEYDPLDRNTRSLGLPIHLDSIARLNALDIKHVYPGHGKRIDDHRRLIARQIERIHERKEQCFDLIAAGNETLPAMTGVMYSHFPESAHFMGLTMILGYLDLLSAEKRIICREVDDVWRYFVAETTDD